MFEEIREIYKLLLDKESRDIFEWRLMYSATKGDQYIEKLKSLYISNICKSLKEESGPELQKLTGLIRDREVVLYGAGIYGQFAKAVVNERIPSAKIQCFVETIPEKKMYLGLPVENIEAYKEKYGESIIILTPCKEEIRLAMKEKLLQAGIPENRILNYDFERLRNTVCRIYLEDFLEFGTEEVFVDAGGYQGETVLDFVHKCPQYDSIFSFEPDQENYVKCCQNLFELERTEVIKKGLYYETKKLRFQSTGTSSRFNEAGDTVVDVTSLDDIFMTKGKIPTYIKMDIEGAELDALKGSCKIISENKPKLAISVYHKADDIVDLVRYIHQLVPEYKFYLRHYTFDECDTVLYAVLG